MRWDLNTPIVQTALGPDLYRCVVHVPTFQLTIYVLLRVPRAARGRPPHMYTYIDILIHLLLRVVAAQIAGTQHIKSTRANFVLHF